MVAYYLWHAEEGCLEGGGAGGYEGGGGVVEQAVGGFAKEGGVGGVAQVDEAVVVGFGYAGGAGYDYLVAALGEGVGGGVHAGEVVAYFLPAAACEEGYDGAVGG